MELVLGDIVVQCHASLQIGRPSKRMLDLIWLATCLEWKLLVTVNGKYTSVLASPSDKGEP